MEFVQCPYDRLSVLQAIPGESQMIGCREDDTDLLFKIGFANQIRMCTLEWSQWRVLHALCKVRPSWEAAIMQQLEHRWTRGNLLWSETERIVLDYKLFDVLSVEANDNGIIPAKVILELNDLNRHGYGEIMREKRVQQKMVDIGYAIRELVLITISSGDILLKINLLQWVLQKTPNLRLLEIRCDLQEHLFYDDDVDDATRHQIQLIELPPLENLATLLIQVYNREEGTDYNISEKFLALKAKLLEAYPVDRVLTEDHALAHEYEEYPMCNCGGHAHHALHTEKMEYVPFQQNVDQPLVQRRQETVSSHQDFEKTGFEKLEDVIAQALHFSGELDRFRNHGIVELWENHAIKNFILLHWLARMEEVMLTDNKLEWTQRRNAAARLEIQKDMVYAAMGHSKVSSQQLKESERQLRSEYAVNNKLVGRHNTTEPEVCLYSKLKRIQQAHNHQGGLDDKELDLLFEIGFAELMGMGALQWTNYHVTHALGQVRPAWQASILKQYEHHLIRGMVKWTKLETVVHLLQMWPMDKELVRYPVLTDGKCVITRKWAVWSGRTSNLSKEAKQDKIKELVKKGRIVWELVITIDESMNPVEIVKFLQLVLQHTPNLRKLEIKCIWDRERLQTEEIIANFRKTLESMQLPELKHLATLVIRLTNLNSYTTDDKVDNDPGFQIFRMVRNKVLRAYENKAGRVIKCEEFGPETEPDTSVQFVACSCGMHLEHELHPEWMEYVGKDEEVRKLVFRSYTDTPKKHGHGHDENVENVVNRCCWWPTSVFKRRSNKIQNQS